MSTMGVREGKDLMYSSSSEVLFYRMVYITKIKVNGVRLTSANPAITSSVCKNNCLDKKIKPFTPGFTLFDNITDAQGQNEYHIGSLVVATFDAPSLLCFGLPQSWGEQQHCTAGTHDVVDGS